MGTAARLLIGLVLAIVSWACVESDFLRGTSCSSDRQCGRSLDCTAGVCGGCPPDIPIVDGSCACPGDRVYDCRRLEAPTFCMPVCRPARDTCTVATPDGAELPRCDGDEGPCFEIAFDTDECSPDAKIVVMPNIEAPDALIVNCPPPDDDDFDCPDDA